jgi:hypothetical protein
MEFVWFDCPNLSPHKDAMADLAIAGIVYVIQ